MNNTDIKKILKHVINSLSQAMYHDRTKELLKTKTFFAGGCIRDLARDVTPKDYDLYFIDEESKNEFVELAKEEFSLKETRINNFNHKPTECQIITLITGTPVDVVNRFDFTVNQGFYCPQIDFLSFGDLGDELVVCPEVLSPLNALVRLIKLRDKGFRFDESTLIGLGIAVSNMEPITNGEQILEALKGLSAPNIEKALEFIGKEA